MKRLLLATLGTAVLCTSAWAQAEPQPAPPPPPGAGANVVFFQPAGRVFAMHEDMKPVLNAPYQAQIVEETTQHLSDGNTIQNTHTMKVARDSQGRTWREQSLEKMGPWSTSSGSTPETVIFISDPVAKTSYVLHPDTKTAEKMPAKGTFAFRDSGGARGGEVVTAMAPGGGGAGVQVADTAAGSTPLTLTIQSPIQNSALASEKSADSTVEDLGTQQINGVTATGKRITHTIPANTIGNTLPIVTVEETWFSTDLKTLVQSKRDDPRFGESTFSLTNIQKGEPPADLFQVPGDYTISSGPQRRPLPLNQ